MIDIMFVEPPRTMNILATRGDKVVFAYPDNGTEWDSKHAWNHLDEGEVYTVDRTIVHRSRTDVYLKEFKDVSFNSVHFKDYTDEEVAE